MPTSRSTCTIRSNNDVVFRVLGQRSKFVRSAKGPAKLGF